MVPLFLKGWLLCLVPWPMYIPQLIFKSKAFISLPTWELGCVWIDCCFTPVTIFQHLHETTQMAVRMESGTPIPEEAQLFKKAARCLLLKGLEVGNLAQPVWGSISLEWIKQVASSLVLSYAACKDLSGSLCWVELFQTSQSLNEGEVISSNVKHKTHSTRQRFP